jgi:hypothetical protein
MKQDRRTFILSLVGVGATSKIILAKTISQRRQRPPKYRLNESLPSVYISFEKIGKAESLDSKEEETYVWLKLHNNIVWPIWTNTSGIPKEYGDVYLYYVIENYEKGERVIDNRPHFSSYNPLPSGRSWVFVAPLSYFEEDCQICINFSFNWEDSNDVFAGREAEHRVCFLASQLPKNNTR